MHTKFIRKEVFPTNNSITSLLNIKENEVEYCKEIIKNNHHYFYVRLVNHGGRCPHCSRFTKKVKEYYNKHIIHSIFIKDSSTIIYQARRFICPECNNVVELDWDEDQEGCSHDCHECGGDCGHGHDEEDNEDDM